MVNHPLGLGLPTLRCGLAVAALGLIMLPPLIAGIRFLVQGKKDKKVLDISDQSTANRHAVWKTVWEQGKEKEALRIMMELPFYHPLDKNHENDEVETLVVQHVNHEDHENPEDDKQLEGRDVHGDDDDDDDSDKEYDELTPFRPVLAELNKDHLPALASFIRRQRDPYFNGNPPIVHEPLYGAYHICFPLEFEDVRWIARFPLNGTKALWDDLSASALESEARTMLLLEAETTIPMPRVYGFSSITGNELNCPYIFMSYIEGVSLHDIWWGRHEGIHDEQMNERCRRRALEGIASSMKQLRKLSSKLGGFMHFNEDGKSFEIQPMRHIDLNASYDHLRKNGVSADNVVYRKYGPFERPAKAYTCTIDMLEEFDDTLNGSAAFALGIKRLLQILIHWLPTPEHGNQFDLTHPDFDLQNFIVSEDGELMGIIDWDNVAMVPRTIGSEQYPCWLTKAWDGSRYRYFLPEENQAMVPGNEDPPETYEYYRRVYREAMSCNGDEMSVAKTDDNSFNATRASLIANNLLNAARDPMSTDHIVWRMVDKIAAVSTSDIELDFYEIAEELGEWDVDVYKMDALEDGFRLLFTKDL